jgi:hypothetical protein
MPGSAWQIGQARDFRGGETQAELPEDIGRNQFTRMENAVIFPNGWITAAHQADKVMISNANLGLAITPYTNGTYNVYSAPGNGVVYGQFLETSASSPANMTYGSQASVDGARIVGIQNAVEFLGKWYCPNPNDDDTKDGILNLTDFSLVNIPGNSAVASKLRAHMNSLWLINSDGTLHISDNGDADTWNALNILLLPNSEPMVDFHPVQGGAIVYGPTSIYAMYGSDYTDLTFIPLMLGKKFTSGSVEIGGIVYVLSTEGIYACQLNGVQLIPHRQEVYFKSCFDILSDPAKVVTAVYQQASKSIMFTWPEVYGGGQALVFYLSGAYSKINKLLPALFPYIIALNDKNTDYLVGRDVGEFAKSEYPSISMLEPQSSIIKTRHEDCDTAREKVWGQLVLETGEVVYGVSILAYLNYSVTPVVVASEAALTAGENTFWLDDISRSKTISFLITINNSAVMEISTDEDPDTLLTDDDGNILTSAINPGNWTLKSIKLRYRPVGPEL